MLEAAREVGYSPNRSARALITGRTHNLALVVPNIANPYFPPIVKTAQRRAQESDYSVFFADVDEDPENERRSVSNLISQVDGLMLCSSQLGAAVINEFAATKPVVTLNRVVEGVPAVLVDSEGGMAQAVDHLAALGHRSIACLGGPSISWSNRARLDGAKAQAAKHNIDLEVFGPYLANYDAGRQAADTVLATNATAILAYDDLMAVGVLSRPSERGVHVPADISVVGFDNVLTHRIVSPALTTVDGRCAIAGRILVVSTAADANAVPVAEFTLAAVLFAGKRVPLLAARYRQQPGEWSWRGRVPHVSNYHRTVGVVGFSRVGQRVVEQLRPFDTTVLVADPLADPAAVASTGVVLISLDELLTRSDTVTLHAPALPETYEMIDAQRLALMRDHSTLINTARGTLVDTNALIEECRHGRIDAILDVTDPEPLPADSPLYDLLPEELAVIVVLHRTPGVRLHLADNTVPGVLALTHDPDDRSPVGQLPSGSQQVLAWQSRPLHHRAPALRLSPDTDALAPARVLDGYQRPYGSGPHMWCSDPTDIQPWLRLDWPQPITVRRVEVIFDDDVHEDLINLHHHRTPGRERPTLVRDYVIETADPDGGWTELPVETGNRRRHRVHELIDARTTTAVRLRVRAINGAPSVHVISVRVYG